MNISAILAGLCFFVGNILIVNYWVQDHRDYNTKHQDWEKFQDMDPTFLSKRWSERLEDSPIILAGDFLNTFAWMLFCAPIIHLAWALSHKGNQSMGMNICIGLLALGGSFTEWMARFLNLGQRFAIRNLVNEGYNLDNWVTTNGNDGMGWQTLEMVSLCLSYLISVEMPVAHVLRETFCAE